MNPSDGAGDSCGTGFQPVEPQFRRQPNEPRTSVRADQVRGGWLKAAVVLAGVVLAAHGWSLGDGLFLDDHWHQQQLAEAGWSWSELLETTTIAPARFMDHWWQQRDIKWQYARPLSVLLQKCVYQLSDGSVWAQHGVSILLHWINACLVWALCRLITRRRGWSLVGGILFAVYPHSVVTVGWLASQNAVLQTALMLASLLVYIRASGLELGASTSLGDPQPLRWRAWMAATVLWVLALFSRENAIVLPAIWLAVDAAFGGRRQVRARLPVYVLAGAVVAAYVGWRLLYFYHPMPDVYLRRPGQGGYLLWCLAKLMHYLCCAIWPTPMAVGPTGRYNPFQESPGDILLMLGILLGLGGGYVWATRRLRGWWVWPLWILLAVLPVVPVLATPHAGYLCGVGFAVAVALGAARTDRRRLRPAAVMAIAFVVGTAAYVKANRLMWKGMTLAERFTVAPIKDQAPPPAVTDVYFINLPFVNVYNALILSEAWSPSTDAVRFHTLVYSPQPVRMEQRFWIRQLDAHSFSVRVEGRPYFSGLLGRFLIDGMRNDGPFRTGQMITGDGFHVRIIKTTEEGVSELAFSFDKPLASGDHRFYVTSYECGALPLRFRGPAATDPADSAEWPTNATRRLELAKQVAAASGADVQDWLDSTDPHEVDWDRIKTWWRESVNDGMLQAVQTDRVSRLDMRHRRDELRRGRALLRRFLRCDLYLTGSPFPGPRPRGGGQPGNP
ncbi:MAG: ArnT family glycosyltransferase [Phycisphaerae bacterium]